MRGMFIKESREYARWAALIGLLIGGGLVAMLIGNRPMSIVSETYLSVLIAAFFGTGIVSGLAVMLGDLRRGHYAFAVVRPVPRWKLFVAKFFAAAALYGVATTVGLAIVTTVAMRSRLTRSPFDVAMLIPSLYFQLAGLAFVAGGMLVAARRAWWFGTRIYPLVLPAVLALVGGVYFESAIAASMVSLATTALLLAVGAAYFTAGGEYRRLAGWARPLAGLCVLVGVGGIVGAGFGAAGDMLTSALGGRPSFADYRQEYYQIGDNGRPVRCVSDNRGNRFYDLAGNETTRPKWTYFDEDEHPAAATQQAVSDNVLRQRGMLSTLDVRDANTPYYYRHRRYSFLTQDRYTVPAWISERDAWHWHYVTARRTFEAYTTDGDYVGCLGPDGTFDTTGRQLPFPDGTWQITTNGRVADGVILFNDRCAYLVRPDARRVETVFIAAPGDPILDVTMLYANVHAAYRGRAARAAVAEPADLPATRVAATTPGKLHVRSADGAAEITVPLPAKKYTMYVNFTAFARHGPGVPDLVVMSDERGMETTELLTLRDGTVTREALPALADNASPGPPRRWTRDLLMAAVPPAALGVKLYAIMARADLTTGQKLAAIPGLFSRRDAFFFGGLLVGLIATAGLVRRYRLGRGATLTWLGLALLLGLHAPLTLICLRERPARAKCPACGKPRPLGEGTCPHCGAAWPVPGDPATDVVEPAQAA